MSLSQQSHAPLLKAGLGIFHHAPGPEGWPYAQLPKQAQHAGLEPEELAGSRNAEFFGGANGLRGLTESNARNGVALKFIVSSGELLAKFRGRRPESPLLAPGAIAGERIDEGHVRAGHEDPIEPLPMQIAPGLGLVGLQFGQLRELPVHSPNMTRFEGSRR